MVKTSDKRKTKAQLIEGLQELRRQVAKLQGSEDRRKPVEGAPWESEERYRQFVENSPNSIFFVDKDGVIQTWNRACEQHFQYGPEEVIGQVYHKLLWNPEDSLVVDAMLSQVWQGRSLSDQNMTYRCKDGTQWFTVSRLYPLYDRGGNVQECILANTDSAARKQAEEALRERAARLELVARVGRRTIAILELDELLRQAVDLIRDAFGYYNVAILLVDGSDVVLRAATLPPARSLEGRTRLRVGSGSITGWVAGSGEPLLVPDVSLEPRYYAVLEEVETKSELAVPIKLKGIVIGVLDVQSDECDAFSQADVFTLQTVADQLAIAISNACLFEETSRRLADARLIQEVVLAAASTLDFDLVLERTVKALHQALGIDHLGFLLPDERDGALVSHPSLVGFAEAAFRIPIEGSLVGWAYRSGRPVLVQDLAQEPAYPEFAYDVRSMLAVPVRVGNRIAAVLHAESPQVGTFGEDELRLFTTIAGQLGVTLENARLYRELQEINRLRTELVQNVGHELRTPLGLIKGYVELLLEGDLGRLLDSQKSALQVIHERTAVLSRLIHNLTILQALPREALALAPISLVEVVEHVLVDFRGSVKGAAVTFMKELPGGLPPVMGDRERLELAFGHLLDNAIKFSPGGGTIILRAWADQDMVYVSITDEGIGIPPEHLDRVFERFFQVNGTTRRRFGGMGVGLALVLEVIETHGGTVGVESEPGGGSTFTVVLPRAERAT